MYCCFVLQLRTNKKKIYINLEYDDWITRSSININLLNSFAQLIWVLLIYVLFFFSDLIIVVPEEWTSRDLFCFCFYLFYSKKKKQLMKKNKKQLS